MAEGTSGVSEETECVFVCICVCVCVCVCVRERERESVSDMFLRGGTNKRERE